MTQAPIVLILILFPFLSFAEPAPVRIGIITDLTGPSAYFGQQVQAGAKLAEKELIAEGIPVQVIIEDNSMNTAKAVAAAQKLLSLDQVSAIYANFTAMVRAIAPVVSGAGALMVYSAGAISISREYPLFFKTYSDYPQGCEALSREFQKQGVKVLGVLKAAAEYGELCSTGVRKVYPDLVEIEYNPGSPLSTEVFTLKRKGAQAIINASFQNDVVNTIKAAQQLSFQVPLGLDSTSVTQQVLNDWPKQLEGSMEFGFKTLPADFVARVDEVSPSARLESYEAVGNAWLHVKQLARAIQKCSPLKSECIATELMNSPPEPIVGFEKWQGKQARLVTAVRKIHDGKVEELSTFISNE